MNISDHLTGRMAQDMGVNDVAICEHLSNARNQDEAWYRMLCTRDPTCTWGALSANLFTTITATSNVLSRPDRRLELLEKCDATAKVHVEVAQKVEAALDNNMPYIAMGVRSPSFTYVGIDRRDGSVLENRPLHSVVNEALREEDRSQFVKFVVYGNPDAGRVTIHTVNYCHLARNTYVPLRLPQELEGISVRTLGAPWEMWVALHGDRFHAVCSGQESVLNALTIMRYSLEEYYSWENMPFRIWRWLTANVPEPATSHKK